MTKQAKFWLGAAFVAGLTLPAAAQDVNADTVVATVNGVNITVGHMIVLRDQLPAQYQQLPDDVLYDGILQQLIQQSVLSQTAEQNLTRRDTLALENERRSYLAGSVLDKTAVAAITDDAVKAAYDAQYAKAEPAKEFNAAHILVETEDEAKALKAQLDKGADFATLAREKTKDPSGTENGGDLGWFGLGMMVKPFEDAVVGMKAGQVSDPIQTQFGWHIVRLNEVRDATPPTIDDVRPEIEGTLQQKAIEDKLQELTNAAKIVQPEQKIDPAVLKNVDLLK